MIEISNAEWSQLFISILLISIFVTLYRRMRRQQQKQLSSNIEQLKLLRILLTDFQKHRGLSTAQLSGDTSLQGELTNTRSRLEESTNKALQLDTSHTAVWHKLIDQWKVIRKDATVSPEKNLLNHHRLIRHTTFLIEDIADSLDLGASQNELSYLNCIWREIVQTAEWTGQARALGTGIAAAQSSSAAQRVRLRFLHEKIKTLSAVAFTTLEQSHTNHLNLQHPKQSVNEFLLCLEQELLNREQPQIEPKLYFEQATQAINELLSMMDTALKDVENAARKI